MADTFVVPFNFQPLASNRITTGGNFTVPAGQYAFVSASLRGSSLLTIDGNQVAATTSNSTLATAVAFTLTRGNSYTVLNGRFTGQMVLKDLASGFAKIDINIEGLPFLRNPSATPTANNFSRPINFTLLQGQIIENLISSDIGAEIYVTGVEENYASNYDTAISYTTWLTEGQNIVASGDFCSANIVTYNKV